MRRHCLHEAMKSLFGICKSLPAVGGPSHSLYVFKLISVMPSCSSAAPNSPLYPSFSTLPGHHHHPAGRCRGNTIMKLRNKGYQSSRYHTRSRTLICLHGRSYTTFVTFRLTMVTRMMFVSLETSTCWRSCDKRMGRVVQAVIFILTVALRTCSIGHSDVVSPMTGIGGMTQRATQWYLSHKVFNIRRETTRRTNG
jgi:hypothetical protein